LSPADRLLGVVKDIVGLAGFAAKMAPQFFERVQEERKRPIKQAPHHPDLAAWPQTGLHAAWIGHSTVFLSLDGFTILTDPVFSSKIGINFGPMTIGLKRLFAPAVSLAKLPRPDLILLSHAHMDHFDLPSLLALEHPESPVVTASRTADLLRADNHGGVHELSWGQSVQIGPANVRAFEVSHWGARMRNDTYRGYNGYLIECGRHRIVFGGDTAYTPNFRQLRTSRAVDLAIMPIGAYNPWIRVHANPEQALSMAGDAGADFILPVHHRTFELGREPAGEPMERLLRAAGPSSDRIALRDIGQEFHRF
jgi:L-ascorbate metabolism protein UlaG (beta-lactamase superfamily)